MAQLLDIRFSFFRRSSKTNKAGQNPVILRISYQGDRRDLFTGLYCLKEEWNCPMGRFEQIGKTALSRNKNLELMLRGAADAFDALKYAGNPFTIEDIVSKIKGKEDKPTLLINFLEDGNRLIKKRVGVEITKATYYKYSRSLRYMQSFLEKEYKVKNFLLSRVDTRFMEKYFHFLRSEKKLSNNTAVKYIEFVKTIFTPSIRDGVIQTDPFRGLRLKKKPVSTEFLTMEEINCLAKLRLNDPDLDRKRDIFLFACYTGLAYIDLKSLKRSDIEQDADGTYYIKKPRQKTGEESIIPLLPAAMRILEKYSITNDFRDFTWYISTNQKMNYGLKHLGKRVGLTKVLHMHLARHTFATTVTLSNGVPLESVSKMLGHANIKQTQHYARVVAMKIKQDMNSIKGLFL